MVLHLFLLQLVYSLMLETSCWDRCLFKTLHANLDCAPQAWGCGAHWELLLWLQPLFRLSHKVAELLPRARKRNQKPFSVSASIMACSLFFFFFLLHYLNDSLCFNACCDSEPLWPYLELLFQRVPSRISGGTDVKQTLTCQHLCA